MKLSRKWDIYVIHHSHTDIGYTERQDKITTYHVDFIRQAIGILNDIHSGKTPQNAGFVWQCENHWQVRNFYQSATPQEIVDFERYVKSGEIGLSGNYLNMTELIGQDALCSRLQQVREYGVKIGFPVKSGMSADINGYAWGYAEALCQNGVENLLGALHPHHGMFPLYRKQIPFYWETTQGNKLLVWNSEHYHFGNALCLSPHAASSYMVYDSYADQMESRQIFKTNAAATEEEEYRCLHDRLQRYLQNLEKEGYPESFIPIMVSGTITDNAPPNAAIAARINRLNELYQDEVSFKMASLDDFFGRVRADYRDIPTYRGDWNDWWADGVGSTPAVVKNFRAAQRKLHLARKLDPDTALGDPALVEAGSENLMLYAEHTWGYSSSVSEPWETLVGDLELKKGAYAVNANTELSRNLDKIYRAKGEVSIRAERPQHYRVINPGDAPLATTALLYVEFWESADGVPFSKDTSFEVVDRKTGEILPGQLKPIARAFQIEVQLTLQPHETRDLELRVLGGKPDETIQNCPPVIGAEGVRDLLPESGFRTDTRLIETDYFRISFDEETGITSLYDKEGCMELLHPDRVYAPFTGVYEVTRGTCHPCELRRRMGRNRKAVSTRRYASVLQDIRITEDGPVYTVVELDYALEGTGFYQVFLMVYKHLPKLRARVRIHKTSVWEPENLYVSLPFMTGETWLDKTGCVIRPGIDQLPGTNKEFYLLQEGLVFGTAERRVAVAVKDTPLVVFGDLKAGPIELCGGEDRAFNTKPAFAWVMNNFWETNFKVDLGGFYEFDFTLQLPEQGDIREIVRLNAVENEGIPAFYTE